jgi:hypothetical protein
MRSVNIHISTFTFPGDVGRHNHPLLGPSVPSADSHGITSFLASQGVPTSDPYGLVHAPPSQLRNGSDIICNDLFTPDIILSAFGFPKPDFLGGHPSRYYYRRRTINNGVLIGLWPSCL